MKTFKAILFLLVLLMWNPAYPAEQKLNQKFSGRVVDASGAVPGFSATFLDLTIQQYTSDEDLMALANILAEKGQDALLKAIEKRENGRIKIGNRLSYPLSVTRTFERDGKTILRAMTDRPIPMIEAWRNNRSTDYPFGFIEIILDAEGKGEGTLIPAAKIQIKEGKLEMESYGREPFRVLNVTKK